MRSAAACVAALLWSSFTAVCARVRLGPHAPYNMSAIVDARDIGITWSGPFASLPAEAASFAQASKEWHTRQAGPSAKSDITLVVRSRGHAEAHCTGWARSHGACVTCHPSSTRALHIAHAQCKLHCHCTQTTRITFAHLYCTH